MADISITREHSLDKDTLRGRLEDLAADLNKKYGVKYRWDHDVCLLDGAGVKKGVVTMKPDSVSVEVTLGMMAKLLKPKIEEEINKKIGKVLAP